jgi:DNA-binding transcriptional ArsR family regulator
MDEVVQPSLHDIQLEDVFSALGDASRLKIVRRLLIEGEMSCKCICAVTPKSTMSHHLSVLRECGVTKTRNVGTQRLVSVREDELDLKFPGLLDLVRRGENLARSIGLEPTTLSSAS